MILSGVEGGCPWEQSRKRRTIGKIEKKGVRQQRLGLPSKLSARFVTRDRRAGAGNKRSLIATKYYVHV
jgi:hypothetical protein